MTIETSTPGEAAGPGVPEARLPLRNLGAFYPLDDLMMPLLPASEALLDDDVLRLFATWGPGKSSPAVLALVVDTDATMRELLAAEHRHRGNLVPLVTRELHENIATVLTVSPPCQAFSTPADHDRPPWGRMSDMILREATVRFREHAHRDFADMRFPALVDLPEDERPTGQGRTTIPKRSERQAELAARTERLRARRKGDRR